ncbi:syntaxin-51-related [Anaeramoeba flamelloides]|uniref:Syntaxin-51-related n=1 Tax=Anaeramoeba flamelloides TaxID=1746091 RepID=A0AAV8ADG3_9EUKA|nr:syntaxin-51-related [Anaeramoeba flamelloides]KAJ6251007.1 syntaxin-51-related [Anaeramoeba flamelloides]|eukprot:Anaeramoba_flamelloidesa115049_142.p1 GENE.a115049_142~~a115049_142.p1  ORF type:complete len:205 (+),score=41.95 a115049_142:74-688(+)
MSFSDWLNKYNSLERDIQQSKILCQKIVSSKHDDKATREARLTLHKSLRELEKSYLRLDKQLNTIKKNPTKYSLTQREYTRRRDELSGKKIEIEKLKNWQSERSQNKINSHQKSEKQLERERVELEKKLNGLDNSQILDMNQKTMKKQDNALDDLSSSIFRISNIAQEIGNELDLQSKLLDNIDTKMDRVDNKLKKNTQKMKKF